VIWIRVWIPDHSFIFFIIAEWGFFGHLLAFLVQSMADLYHTWRNGLCQQDSAFTTFLGHMRQTSGCRLIRKFRFESRITYVSTFGIGKGLRSLSALVVLYIVSFVRLYITCAICCDVVCFCFVVV